MLLWSRATSRLADASRILKVIDPTNFACYLIQVQPAVASQLAVTPLTPSTEMKSYGNNCHFNERSLEDMDERDDFLTGRYQEGKSEAEFRRYDEKATPGLAEFYRLNHQYQTFDYAVGRRRRNTSAWTRARRAYGRLLTF